MGKIRRSAIQICIHRRRSRSVFCIHLSARRLRRMDEPYDIRRLRRRTSRPRSVAAEASASPVQTIYRMVRTSLCQERRCRQVYGLLEIIPGGFPKLCGQIQRCSRDPHGKPDRASHEDYAIQKASICVFFGYNGTCGLGNLTGEHLSA